jgi:hypothetical protein
MTIKYFSFLSLPPLFHLSEANVGYIIFLAKSCTARIRGQGPDLLFHAATK